MVTQMIFRHRAPRSRLITLRSAIRIGGALSSTDRGPGHDDVSLDGYVNKQLTYWPVMIAIRTVDRGSARRFVVYARDGIGRIIPGCFDVGTGPGQHFLRACGQPMRLL